MLYIALYLGITLAIIEPAFCGCHFRIKCSSTNSSCVDLPCPSSTPPSQPLSCPPPSPSVSCPPPPPPPTCPPITCPKPSPPPPPLSCPPTPCPPSHPPPTCPPPPPCPVCKASVSSLPCTSCTNVEINGKAAGENGRDKEEKGRVEGYGTERTVTETRTTRTYESDKVRGNTEGENMEADSESTTKTYESGNTTRKIETAEEGYESENITENTGSVTQGYYNKEVMQGTVKIENKLVKEVIKEGAENLTKENVTEASMIGSDSDLYHKEERKETGSYYRRVTESVNNTENEISAYTTEFVTKADNKHVNESTGTVTGSYVTKVVKSDASQLTEATTERVRESEYGGKEQREIQDKSVERKSEKVDKEFYGQNIIALEETSTSAVGNAEEPTASEDVGSSEEDCETETGENIVLDCCVSCDDRCRNRVTREQLLAVRGSNQRSAEHRACNRIKRAQNTSRCNDERLRVLLERHMISSDVRETKRLIQAAAEKSFGGSFNVICSNGSFSFITHTEKYCQASGAGIVCYAFKAD